MSGGGERTEQPTARKRRESRREGQIIRTPELGSWGALLVTTLLLPMAVGRLMRVTQQMVQDFQGFIRHPDQGDALGFLSHGMREGAIVIAIISGGIMVTGVVAAVAQGGLQPATKLLIPKFSRLNPLTGFKRNFGPQSLWELLKNLFKVGVISGVIYSGVRDLIPVIMGSGTLPLRTVMETVARTSLSTLRTVAIAGLVMAAADYLVMRRRVGKKIKMTKNEVKDEHKRTEGDPLIKGQIRSRQHAMSRNRMMAEMSQADVVVVNPTHVAVALRYEPDKGAPRVIAKGAGAIAAKIREKATEHRIPMVQDVPLARALYGGCEIGQAIPMEFYGAVARVLAFVMSLKARGSAAGLHHSPQ